MWFSATLDTNSPWGTSFPLSVPAQSKKEVGVLDSKPSKPLQQTFATDFVQISSNQRWNTQNLFSQNQNEINKKTSKITAPAPVVSPETFSNDISVDSAIEDETIVQNLYKTELCRSFEETGSCRYGLKCQFAHGRAEIRTVTRHPKYKTEVCKTFHTIGTCPYGKRCRFIHSEAPIVPPGSLKPTPPISEIKAPIVKTPIFENINPKRALSTNNWTSAFPPSTTTVNFPAVEKGSPVKVPVEQLSSTMKEFHERRSRLGIFQQICS